MSSRVNASKLDLESVRSRWPELADALAEIPDLAGVLAWAAATGLAVREIAVVTQDEFTHDVILPWRVCWLVFGVT